MKISRRSASSGGAAAWRVFPRALLLGLAACVACGGPGGGGGPEGGGPLCSTRSSSLALMGGSPEPSLPLSEGQRLAIVDLTLATELDVGTLVAECTGTVIADGWVLTARHCVPGKGETTRARLAFAVSDPESAGSMDPCGDPARAGDVEVPAARVVRHASLDLALLDLGGAGLPEGVTPIAWTGDAGIEGGQLAGYGLSAGTPGLLFKTERVTAQTEFEITVDAGDGGGACSGDSGGPLLVRDPSGAILVAATLRGGEADCSGEDAFVKVDARWIEAHVGPSASSP